MASTKNCFFFALFLILADTALGFTASPTLTSNGRMFGRVLQQQHVLIRTARTTATRRFMSTRKAGVSSPEELKEFVATAGEKLVVVDVRNPDAGVEPGDQKSLAVAALPSEEFRKQAVHLIWDRSANSMPLPDVDKGTPIITHCGGGGRGQKAKDYLESNGFTSVLNGGGPKETECWAEFGEK